MNHRFRRRFLAPCLVLSLALPTVADAQATQDSVLDLKGLSPAVGACADFYTYANEKWLKEVKIPDDRSAWGTFYEIGQRNEVILREALEGMARNPDALPDGAIRKAIEYYVSGMDTQTIDALGLKPLESELARIDAIKSKTELPAAFARMTRLGVAAPIAWTVRQDHKNATRYTVELSQSGLGLPDRDFYFAGDKKSKEWRAAYLKHVEAVFVLMGDAPADAAKRALRVFALETKLAGASMKLAEARDAKATFNPRTLGTLSKGAPGFAWESYFRSAGLEKPEKFNVAQPKFLAGVAKLAGTTPLEDWKLYLRWHLARAASDKLAAPFEQASFLFYEKTLSGKQQQAPRHRRVIDTIGGQYGELPLGQGLAQIFVQRAFAPEAKARALEMVGNVKLALQDRLLALEWMSPETKKRALEKLAAMQVKIGYPDEWRDFTGLKIDRKGYLANWFLVNEREFDRNLAKLPKPVDRGEWEMGPHIVNAYYNPYLNEIVFPAGILQPPFFDAKADDAVNYGAIGMVIGHEITHGFDDYGRQYDAEGNLKDWWTKEDAKRYEARAADVVKQFSAYEVIDGLKLNGKLTLGENISDLGGLKIAYLALQKAQAKKPQGRIDELTPEQRFFISYAQSWRESSRAERIRNLLTTDAHSPPRFRVQGPLANLPEFSQTFGCKPEDAALKSAASRVNIW
jgi:putative endopeptidase